MFMSERRFFQGPVRIDVPCVCFCRTCVRLGLIFVVWLIRRHLEHALCCSLLILKASNLYFSRRVSVDVQNDEDFLYDKLWIHVLDNVRAERKRLLIALNIHNDVASCGSCVRIVCRSNRISILKTTKSNSCVTTCLLLWSYILTFFGSSKTGFYLLRGKCWKSTWKFMILKFNVHVRTAFFSRACVNWRALCMFLPHMSTTWTHVCSVAHSPASSCFCSSWLLKLVVLPQSQFR